MAQRRRNSEVTSGAGKVLKSPTKREKKSAAASALTQRPNFAKNVREIGKRDSAGLIKLADR